LKPTRHLMILCLAAAVALCVIGCGDDDDSGADGGSATAEAVAPPPGSAFNDLEAALEAQGLTVTQIPKASLDGAETGVDISGSQTGSGRSFASAAKATDYADGAAKGGDKTKVVGTVTFQAPTQDDLDFIVDAYEN
jgi:hypothetical protein